MSNQQSFIQKTRKYFEDLGEDFGELVGVRKLAVQRIPVRNHRTSTLRESLESSRRGKINSARSSLDVEQVRAKSWAADLDYY